MRVLRIAVYAWALALTPAAFAGDVQTRVLGGKDAAESEWPWMVAVLENAVDNNFQAQFCGGALISPQWIVSAAHCFQPGEEAKDGTAPPEFSASEIRVLIDTVELCDDCQDGRLEIAELYIPDGSRGPEWDPSTEANIDDIALLRLESPVAVATASVIDAPRSAALSESGDDGVQVLGWGASQPNPTGDRDYLFPFTLQQAALDFVPLHECKGFYSRDELFSDAMLCAHEPDPDTTINPDTCVGDSGGPLVLERDGTDWVAGITSWGFDCGDPDSPGVYTELRAYETWLEAVTASTGAPGVDVTAELATASSRYAGTGETLEVEAALRNNARRNGASGVLGELNTSPSASASDVDDRDELECQDQGSGQLECTASTPLAAQTAAEGNLGIQHSGGRARVSVSLTAEANEGDYRAGNDAAEQALIFSDEPDMALSFGEPVPSAEVASVPLTVSNKATHQKANNISFTLNLPAGISLDNPEELNCNGNPWVCRPGDDLKVASSIDYNLELSADATGSYAIDAAADSDSGDFPDDAPDDSVSLRFPDTNGNGSDSDDSSGGAATTLAVLLLASGGLRAGSASVRALAAFRWSLLPVLYSRRKKRSRS